MSIKSFYLSNINKYYNNKTIRKGIYSYKKIYGFEKEKTNKKLFIRIFTSLLEEAEIKVKQNTIIQNLQFLHSKILYLFQPYLFIASCFFL